MMTALFDPDCPFCEIVAREDPDAREVYRDANVVAFFPTEPATLGHVLLIPREHVATIWELQDSTASHLAQAAVGLARAVRDATGAPGLNIIQSNGESATQTVTHVHIHLVPRWPDDNLGRIWPPETGYSENQKDNAWRSVRENVLKQM